MDNLTIEQLQKQLEDAKAEINRQREARDAADKKAAAAEAALHRAGAPAPISGIYKGHSFADGHRCIRNKKGQLGDTQAILDAANAGDPEACALLDWLIEIKYAYFTPADAKPAAKKAGQPAGKKG